jgi:hypothetical protein
MECWGYSTTAGTMDIGLPVATINAIIGSLHLALCGAIKRCCRRQKDRQQFSLVKLH